MARRRTARKSAPRKRFKGINITNTAVDVYQANAMTTLVMGQGLYGAFVQPWISTDTYAKYKAHGTDSALDIRELADGLMGKWKAGTGGRYSGGGADWFGQGYKDGPAGVIINNVTKQAIPTAFKIVGSNVAKKFIRKTGVSRSLNKLTRQIGFSDMIRF